MSGHYRFQLAWIVLLALLVVACTQTAPAPTSAPASSKASESAKASVTATPAAAAPTGAAPTSVKQASWPQKDKPLTMIVPLEPGAAADASARLLAVPLEKELGIPVQVVNKPGAGMQTGTTEFVRSKNDGYTICMTNLPTILGLYLDPERKAIFGRKDFLPLALMGVDPAAIGVKANSPFKSLKDIIDAAKANPGKVTIGLTGLKSHQHLAFLELQKLAGVHFNMVVFDGSAPTMTALLGGHIDVQLSSVGVFMPQVKSGGVRVLAVADAKESPFLPGVKTLEAQGYKLYNSNSRGWSLLAGTPKEAVDTLSVAMKKAMADPTFQSKMAEQGLEVRYMAPDEYAAYWDNMEKQVKPLLDEIAATTK